MTEHVLSPQGQQCLQALMRVWFEFERQLGRVPLLQRLERDHAAHLHLYVKSQGQRLSLPFTLSMKVPCGRIGR